MREGSLVVLCIKRCDLNSCIVIFVTLNFVVKENIVSDIVIIKFSVKQEKKSLLELNSIGHRLVRHETERVVLSLSTQC